MSKPVRLPPITEHWKLVKIVDKAFGRTLETILNKVPTHLYHEFLRLIADDCYARIEKLEDNRGGSDE